MNIITHYIHEYYNSLDNVDSSFLSSSGTSFSNNDSTWNETER